jgi:hypothetical protein
MGRSVETRVLSIPPSISLLAFVQRQISQTEPYVQRELQEARRPFLAKPVLAYPADDIFSPIGASRVMVIRDVSRRSFALAHEERQLDWPRVLLRISLKGCEALLGAEVRWNRPIGPFYLMGCQIHPQFDSILPDDC